MIAGVPGPFRHADPELGGSSTRTRRVVL